MEDADILKLFVFMICNTQGNNVAIWPINNMNNVRYLKEILLLIRLYKNFRGKKIHLTCLYLSFLHLC